MGWTLVNGDWVRWSGLLVPLVILCCGAVVRWRRRRLATWRDVWPDLAIGVRQRNIPGAKHLGVQIVNRGWTDVGPFDGELTQYRGDVVWPSVLRPGDDDTVWFEEDASPVFRSAVPEPRLVLRCRDKIGLSHEWTLPLVQEPRADGRFNLRTADQRELNPRRPSASLLVLWRNRRTLKSKVRTSIR
jgi:hypothetical protein